MPYGAWVQNLRNSTWFKILHAAETCYGIGIHGYDNIEYLFYDSYKIIISLAYVSHFTHGPDPTLAQLATNPIYNRIPQFQSYVFMILVTGTGRLICNN